MSTGNENKSGRVGEADFVLTEAHEPRTVTRLDLARVKVLTSAGYAVPVESQAWKKQSTLNWEAVVPGFLYLLLWTLILAATNGYGSTVCVSPLMTEDGRVRELAGMEIERVGHSVTDCSRARWELVLQPLNWTAQGGTNFLLYRTDSREKGSTISTGGLYVWRPAWRRSEWQVALYPTGQVRSLYRGQGGNLRKEIRRAMGELKRQ